MRGTGTGALTHVNAVPACLVYVDLYQQLGESTTCFPFLYVTLLFPLAKRIKQVELERIKGPKNSYFPF